MLDNTIDSTVLSTMNGTSSTTSSSTSTSTTSSAEDLQEEFLTLLTTELQNQNPLEPMDNTEMISQLAQISTVSSLEGLNTTLDSITEQINASQALAATELVGKGVLVAGDQVLVGSGEATEFGVELGGAADSVTVTITDSSGEVVREMDLGSLDAGVHTISWDATLDDGSVAPDGSYTVSIAASSDGEAVTSTTLAYAEVTGVSNNDDSVLLYLGANQETASLDDVREVL